MSQHLRLLLKVQGECIVDMKSRCFIISYQMELILSKTVGKEVLKTTLPYSLLTSVFAPSILQMTKKKEMKEIPTVKEHLNGLKKHTC